MRVPVVIGLIAIVGSAAAVSLAPSQASDQDAYLTHTIGRGKLTVSVTEQGTVESSNNTEIKCKVRGFSLVTYVVPAGSVVKVGQELVRLDTKVIEEQHSLTKTNTFIAEATLAQTQANVETAKIAIDAYEKGRFRSQLQGLEKELAAHKRNLRTARKMYQRSESLFRQGYATDLEVEGNAFTVTQAELELKVKETEIKVLKDFTRQMQMESLNGNKIASESKLAADQAGLAMEVKRRDRAAEELNDCVIRAEKPGLVIYPSAASWKTTPDITEGASVRKDQVLLLMPDLTQMQVKLGIHESVIDRVRPGLKAIVTLPDRTLEATVSEVASVTKPAGWWTGNVVKYDTVIDLPSDEGLKPGMSAEVDVILAVHENVVTIPVAAVVETEEGEFCWVQSTGGPQKRILQLGDSNDVFIEVIAGLNEGEEVILNPTALIEEAEEEARSTLSQSRPSGDSQDVPEAIEAE
ncbi:efflux RND transporter periplasmic adaptor subunit [Planctomycetes bacterium K23_9]|uniref:Macrolide export protein MacA n=1 Tax=Stieleria marina TaxID=1930275 RepID=A0A517NTZ5_9BACT|nr:Macrolide export protein MacA [Planctomycetes bacterium K23_9]